jgi:hypothetical protein
VAPRTLSLSVENVDDIPDRDFDWELLERSKRWELLLPLAFALATIDVRACAPVLKFQTTIYPIRGVSGYSSSSSGHPDPLPETILNREQADVISDWSHRLARRHDDSLQVAERRVISAISHRVDKEDALIDGVISWESLVGTRTETVYRVTTALAKLLEPEPSMRLAFRKRLNKIYDIRSRVVHGDIVADADIWNSADEAITVALKALRELYERSAEWRQGKSSDRSDRLILGD